MKKMFLLLSVAAMVTLANAQTPVNATLDLNSRYRNVQASWMQENEHWVATFQNNNQQCQAYYQTDGTWLGTETPSSMSAMSQGAQNFVNTRFIGEGSSYAYLKSTSRTNGEVSYDVAYLSTGNNQVLKLFFDTNGSLVRRELIPQ